MTLGFIEENICIFKCGQFIHNLVVRIIFWKIKLNNNFNTFIFAVLELQRMFKGGCLSIKVVAGISIFPKSNIPIICRYDLFSCWYLA